MNEEYPIASINGQLLAEVKYWKAALDAERENVQTLTDELNRIREMATKTDWNLALRIDTVLEKVGKVSKKYQN
jgi:hypothetical protein